MDIDWGKLASAVSRNPFVIGAIGALMALKYVPGDKFWDKCWNLGGGCITAGLGTPALAEWLGWSSTAIISFASLIIGFTSMTLMAELLLALKAIKWADLLSGGINNLIAHLTGKGKE